MSQTFKFSNKWLQLALFSKAVKLAVIALALAWPQNAEAFDSPKTSAKQVFIQDFETGQILFEKAAQERMPTSSMSKVITAYAIFDAIEEGKISMDTKYLVSEKAWRMGGSKMFVPLGEEVSVSDLLKGVIIQSGNDATVVLAEGLSGSEEGFAKVLNAKAKELGMTNSHFMNASGWPDDNHYSTAEDLGKLATALIKNQKAHYPLYSETEFKFNDILQYNRNPLLYKNIGADGIKTGHTEAGGYGLMASAVNDGRRVIMVINGVPSNEERSTEALKLMQWALSQFENKVIANPDQILGEAPILYGKAKVVPYAAQDTLSVTLPTYATGADVTQENVLKDSIVAPVKKGDVIGEVSILYKGDVVKTTPLIALSDVAESNPVMKLFQKIGNAI
ncbi:MAG: D-alanyl-D-alanine carboxypeptidase [Micavibrio sp.]|nr:D-alanyl-D-alanine carboxypeptidase [Micavibrio sp.]|tara:strand:+ start:328682 stop:329857 length:1176 start_codon:yes stop_codon:yes gene_type:complete